MVETISGSRVFSAAETDNKGSLVRTFKFQMMAQLTLDGDDELRDDGEDLGISASKEVKDSLNSEESVWVLLLADTFHEDWEVVMIIELVHFNFPLNFV